jgi:hypothetical protein
MSEEPIDDIELEEAEPVDGSFLDVSLVEEVNSNSQENYCCGVCNKVFRRKAHLVRHSSPYISTDQKNLSPMFHPKPVQSCGSRT